MKKNVLYIRHKKENEYHVVISGIEDWEGFEKLAKYLEVNYQAELLESVDGPDARRWIFLIKGHKIELIHNDGYGNYLISPTVSGEELITEIGKDLDERLSRIE